MAVAVLVAGGVLLAVAGPGKTTSDVGYYFVGVFAPGYIVAGYLLATRRPDLPVGWLYLTAGAGVSAAATSAAYTAAALERGWPAADTALLLCAVLFPLQALSDVALMYAPDGVMGRRWRWLPWAMVAVVVAASALVLLAPGPIRITPDDSVLVRSMTNPVGSALGGQVFATVRDGLLGSADILGLLAVMVVIVKAIALRGESGRRVRWLVVVILGGFAATIATVSVAPRLVFIPGIATTLAGQAVVVASILRWRLYGVDVVVRRSVLWLALLLGALGPYAAVVLFIGLAIGHTGPVASGVAATVAVLTFGPLSTRIRQSVNRAFYGRRGDPHAVVTDLGRRLSAAPGPEDALIGVTDALTEGLRLPFASIVAASGERLVTRGALEHGDEPSVIRLTHQGEVVGELQVGHRRGETALAAADRTALEELAHHVGAAVRAVALVRDLTRAKTRLVAARDDERTRLQRDLHDGLGPTLTAILYTVQAASNHLDDDSDATRGLLQQAAADTQRTIDDVRRIVYALGDPALDELSLADAVRVRADRLQTHGPRSPAFEVDASDIGPLPSDVEVATFRIVSEAMANVVRHARATTCRVSLRADEACLDIKVLDDGRGIGESSPPGVGITSMRDRAEALGGTFRLDAAPGGGTLLAVNLPLHGSAHRDRA